MNEIDRNEKIKEDKIIIVIKLFILKPLGKRFDMKIDSMKCLIECIKQK